MNDNWGDEGEPQGVNAEVSDAQKEWAIQDADEERFQMKEDMERAESRRIRFEGLKAEREQADREAREIREKAEAEDAADEARMAANEQARQQKRDEATRTKAARNKEVEEQLSDASEDQYTLPELL